MSREDDIKASLQEILSHEIFIASPKAQAFLTHIVTESLAERGALLNETTIAQDIFGKGSEFDPAHDSLVRVSARRVRHMLRLYYLEAPFEHRIKISIPKGQYWAHFEKIENNVKSNQAGILSRGNKSSLAKFAMLILLTFAVGTILYLLVKISDQNQIISKNERETNSQLATGNEISKVRHYPLIAVANFSNETGSDKYNFLEEGLQRKLVEDLSRFSLIRPVIYRGTIEALLAKKDEPYNYGISAFVLSVEPELDLYIKLIDLETSATLYERRFKRSVESSEYFDSLSDIVTELSGRVEATISVERLKRIERQTHDGTVDLANIDAFDCVGLTDKLFVYPSPDLYRKAYTCLDNLLAEDPDNATLLAYFGALIFVGARSYEPILQARSVDPDINEEIGIEMIKRAVDIDPLNATAQLNLSELYKMMEDNPSALKHAELAYIANPGDPEIIISLSRQLVNIGQWDRARSLAKEALERNPDPDAAYYRTDFAWSLIHQDTENLQILANKIAELDGYYADLFLYLAAVANDDQKTMATLHPSIINFATRNNNHHDIMVIVKSIIDSEEFQSKARDFFVKGGVITEDGILILKE